MSLQYGMKKPMQYLIVCMKAKEKREILRKRKKVERF